MSKIFIPGDIIKFNDIEYIVVQNYGETGLIKENSKNGILINNFRWNENNPNCLYIGNTKDNNELIKIASNELENFFNKYKI